MDNITDWLINHKELILTLAGLATIFGMLHQPAWKFLKALASFAWDLVKALFSLLWFILKPARWATNKLFDFIDNRKKQDTADKI